MTVSLIYVIYLGNGLGSTASSTNHADRYPSYENPRADGNRGLGDCVCVPYDQCLPHEIARKEDGLYIDPRTNGGTNIEAITLDDVITDTNGSVISRHAKRQNDGGDEFVAETRDEGEQSDEKQDENTTEETVTEVTLSEDKNSQRKRREIPVNGDNDGKETAKADVRPVSTHKQTTAPRNLHIQSVPKPLTFIV